MGIREQNQNGDSVAAKFHQTARQFADHVALIALSPQGSLEFSLNYRDLDSWSDSIARKLQAMGVEPQQRVGLVADRSAMSIAAILAITKLGGVYVPLDRDYPPERLQYMLEDTGIGVCIGSESARSVFAEYGIELLIENDRPGDISEADTIEPAPLKPTDPLYIMYTSGSTGKPKGVEVVQSGVLRLVAQENQYATFNESIRFLQLAPLTFDASTLEIWGPLLNGGSCCVYPFTGLPDPETLIHIFEQHAITSLWLTAALFNWCVEDERFQGTNLKELLVGGEALSVSHIKKAQDQLPNTQLINGYGPTETTTFACCFPIPKPLPKDWKAIPIGYPIYKTPVYILNDHHQLVEKGAEGQLCIAGDGLARGYVGQEALTAEKFITLTLSGSPIRLYCTGDVVRQGKDGAIEYIGRVDDQVKIAGHRIELGEINACILTHKNIKTAYTLVSDDGAGSKRLISYVVHGKQVDGKTISENELKDYLANTLPKHMLPARIIFLDHMPMNQNGKVDRRALPATNSRGEHLKAIDIAGQLAELWCTTLGLTQANDEDNFFASGGTSLIYMAMVTQGKKNYQLQIKPLDIFEHPTFGALKNVLLKRANADAAQQVVKPKTSTSSSTETHAIAIIGMSGRFPGANNVDEFWENLCQEVESIETIDSDGAEGNGSYVNARGVIHDYDCFDAEFFGISPKEAEISDPQQRVFLEEAWRTLESAGYTPGDSNRIGVFAGSGHNAYMLKHVLPVYGTDGGIGELPTQFVNDKDYIATRTAFKLNLQGPCLSINTACSTSLVAIIEAVKSLRQGDCDMALAGGVSLQIPMFSGYPYQEGGMLSKDGSTRPFDQHSTGTTFNSGVALVALKRLQDAQQDGDHIYAVIKGVGINNDGADKASFTAPSVSGQTNAVARALHDAQCPVDSITYVEAHGTATPLGDPIEVEALNRAFQQNTQGPLTPASCYIGSAKSNVGHLVSAAGATGLIKTSLALQHKQIPATLHYSGPNPHIDFSATPFAVCDKTQAWLQREDTPLRAGVSSFGVGGTNAHVVVEQAPEVWPRPTDKRSQLICVSAKDPQVLQNYEAELIASIRPNQLADAAYTTQVSRSSLSHKSYAVIHDWDKLAAPVFRRSKSGKAMGRLVFAFSGQGSQRLNMGHQLYFNQEVYRQHFDLCAEQFAELINSDLRELIFTQTDDEERIHSLNQTHLTQPALFAVEYALAQMWLSLGIEPALLIGHSIGEYTAAALSGVFSLEDAIKVVARRGTLMQEMPTGSMIAVQRPLEEVQAYLPKDCELAVMNAPTSHVISGPSPSIDALTQSLAVREIPASRLRTSHAFHSAMMEPAAADLTQFIATLHLNRPTIPILSTKTGQLLSDTEATSAEYWGQQLREPVNFLGAMQELAEDDYLLEVGPGKVLATLAKASIAATQVSDSGLDSSEHEYDNWLNSVGRLWQWGCEPNWVKLHTEAQPVRVPLATYPFKRTRFFIESQGTDSARGTGDIDKAINMVINSANDPETVKRLLLQQLQIINQQLQLLNHPALKKDR